MGAEITGSQWTIFAIVVIVLLTIDLITIRGGRTESRRASVIWSIVWVGSGLSFTFYVWLTMDADSAQKYLAAYLIEKSLSLDNLFMFLLIFRTLNIRKRDQHTVLFWGILGAVIFRGIFILLGARALEQFEWTSFVFGGLLFFAAYRAFREDPFEEKESELVIWLARHLPVSPVAQRTKFIEKQNGRRVATPLFIALLAVEATDVMFAIDSVPAALSMTRNLFLVYSSNIFAILGLRALYLVLAGAIGEQEHLHHGLAVVLAFAAVKIVLDPWIEIPPALSVAIIVLVISVSIWVSVGSKRRDGGGSLKERKRA